MAEKQFNKLTQSLLNSRLEKKSNLIDWDFELNGKPMQLFKAGDKYCHSIGGKDDFTNDMYFFPLEIWPNVTPEDCRPFSDRDLAPKWSIHVEPYCSFKTKWGDESMRSSIIAKIYRNGKCFGAKHGFTHNDAYIAAYSYLQKLIDHPVNFFSRNWKSELLNRKIYYDNQPAIVSNVWVDESGCNIYVKPDKEKIAGFVPQGHWLEDKDEVQNWEYDEGTGAELTCSSIYWFRD